MSVASPRTPMASSADRKTSEPLLQTGLGPLVPLPKLQALTYRVEGLERGVGAPTADHGADMGSNDHPLSFLSPRTRDLASRDDLFVKLCSGDATDNNGPAGLSFQTPQPTPNPTGRSAGVLTPGGSDRASPSVLSPRSPLSPGVVASPKGSPSQARSPSVPLLSELRHLDRIWAKMRAFVDKSVKTRLDKNVVPQLDKSASPRGAAERREQLEALRRVREQLQTLASKGAFERFLETLDESRPIIGSDEDLEVFNSSGRTNPNYMREVALREAEVIRRESMLRFATNGLARVKDLASVLDADAVLSDRNFESALVGAEAVMQTQLEGALALQAQVEQMVEAHARVIEMVSQKLLFWNATLNRWQVVIKSLQSRRNNPE